MLQQSRDGGRVEDAGVVNVEAEVVVPLLDARVQGAAVAAEADGEEVVFLRGVSEEEGALRLSLQQVLCLVAVHHPPVRGEAGDLQQVWNQTMNVIDLSVDAVSRILAIMVLDLRKRGSRAWIGHCDLWVKREVGSCIGDMSRGRRRGHDFI